MLKYMFLLLSVAFFLGCSPTNDTTQDTDDTEEIAPTADIDYENDTVVNQSVARVPHTNSSIPMLGILLSYNNQAIKSSESVWASKLFGKSEHQLNHYYIEVSNGNFEFIPANENSGITDNGIVSVSLNKDHPDTDINDFSAFERNVYPDLKTSLETLDNNIDFSNYDSDANGYITPDELLLTFIVAGYEDSYEGSHVTNAVWGHQYCTNSADTPILDGVSLMGCANEGNFAMFGELHDKNNPHDATIGIIAHELGHSAFSLPDLYNTYNPNSGGIGYFGIMGAGTWTRVNSNEFYGNTPTHFSAWSKVYMNWITPIEQKGFITLEESSSNNQNIIKIPISANHYYLIENRNNNGYDKGLYSLTGEFDGGMAIWHINQNKLTEANFEMNSVNNDTTEKAVDLVEANYSTAIDNGYGGDEEALFYSPHVSSFNAETDITNISPRGSSMSLNIN